MAASAVYILGVSQQCHPTDTVLNTIRPKLITLYSYRVCQPRCDMFGVQLIFWSGLFFRFLFLASSFKIVSPQKFCLDDVVCYGYFLVYQNTIIKLIFLSDCWLSVFADFLMSQCNVWTMVMFTFLSRESQGQHVGSGDGAT